MAVLDADGMRIASYGEAPAVDLASAPAVLRSADTLRLAEADGLWAVAVSAAGQRLGALVLGGVDALDDGQGRTVERAAMVTALVLLFRLRAAEADHRVRADLLAELLARPDGGELDAALVERGRLLGLRLQRPHVVAVCHCGPTRPRGLLLAGGLVGEHRGSIVVLLPGDAPSAVARDLAQLAEGVTIGTAGPVVPGRGLRATHAEARRAADALDALGMSGRAAAAADLGFAGLVVGDAPDVDGYLGQILGPVAAYDEARGSDLLGTLDAWFACSGSPRRAAERLHVHANTVAQRLDRVAALLGEDWATPERALEIQLALRLRRLRR